MDARRDLRANAPKIDLSLTVYKSLKCESIFTVLDYRTFFLNISLMTCSKSER